MEQYSPAGDFNGDGYAYILINHAGFNYFYRSSNENRNERGRVYIVKGQAENKEYQFDYEPIGAWSDWSQKKGGEIGFNIAFTNEGRHPDSPNPRSNDPSYAGDINGDGLSDILIPLYTRSDGPSSFLLYGDYGLGNEDERSGRDVIFMAHALNDDNNNVSLNIYDENTDRSGEHIS